MEIYNKPSGGGGGGKGGGTSSSGGSKGGSSGGKPVKVDPPKPGKDNGSLSGGTSAQPGVSVPAKKPKSKDVDFAPMLLVMFIGAFAFIVVLWFLLGRKK